MGQQSQHSARLASFSDEQVLRWATYASVATASVLIVIKAAAWWLTDSVSVLASLVDSLMDVAASLINLFAVAHALVPADHEHRFGHGKVESLAGLGQAIFVFISALFLLVNAYDRLQNPHALQAIEWGAVVTLVSIVLTVLLLLFQAYVVKRTDSLAVKADALHYRSDLATNAVILLALGLSYYGYQRVDPIFAIVIAMYILYSAWSIVTDSIQILLDRELPDDMRNRIIEVAEAIPQVKSIHELRTRRSGITHFIQLHIDLDAQLTLQQAHSIADQVEAAICAIIPNADVIIHEDPK